MLKDLEKKNKLPFDLEIHYFGSTSDHLISISDLEYWKTQKKQWSVNIYVEEGKTLDIFNKSSFNPSFIKSEAKKVKNTNIFISIHHQNRLSLIERLQLSQYNNNDIHWFN